MSLKLSSVLIIDEVDPKCIAILQENGVDIVKNTKLANDKQALLAKIPKYDGLIVRFATTVTADLIEASNLKIIGRAGTATDNIDTPAVTRKGVVVMNTICSMFCWPLLLCCLLHWE